MYWLVWPHGRQIHAIQTNQMDMHQFHTLDHGLEKLPMFNSLINRNIRLLYWCNYALLITGREYWKNEPYPYQYRLLRIWMMKKKNCVSTPVAILRKWPIPPTHCHPLDPDFRCIRVILSVLSNENVKKWFDHFY